jgi:hypothetical protein
MKEGLSVSKPQEHLLEGVTPIIACVGTFDDFAMSKDPSLGEISELEIKGLKSVDWEKGIYASGKGKALSGGPETYIISAIDSSNKFSQTLTPCTGLVAAGKENKKNGKNISFLSHQDPEWFLSSKKDDFIKDLRKRLLEIKERSKPGTIDVRIIGGDYSVDPVKDYRKEYLESIKLLSSEIKEILKFEPLIVNGPKKSLEMYDWDDIYYDTEHRRLYVVRPKVNQKTPDFRPSEIHKFKNGF